MWESSKQLLNYTNWSPGQPDNAGNNEDCVEIRGLFNYKWNDHVCSLKKYFICESIHETCDKCAECPPIQKSGPMLWYAEPINFQHINEGVIKIEGKIQNMCGQP